MRLPETSGVVRSETCGAVVIEGICDCNWPIGAPRSSTISREGFCRVDEEKSTFGSRSNTTRDVPGTVSATRICLSRASPTVSAV